LITLEKCKEILKDTANGLTDEQILEIRSFLSSIADVAIKTYINDSTNNLNEGCNYVSRE